MDNNEQNACGMKEEKSYCQKIRCLVLGLILVFSLISMTETVILHKKFNKFLKATQIDLKAVPEHDFLISEKYDKGQSMEKALKTGKPVIAWFYVDWCGFCKKFASTFDAIIKDPKIKDNLAIAFIDCSDEKNQQLVEEYKIEAFPTVYMLNPKKNIKEFVENQELFTEDAVKKLTDKFLNFAGK